MILEIDLEEIKLIVRTEFHPLSKRERSNLTLGIKLLESNGVNLRIEDQTEGRDRINKEIKRLVKVNYLSEKSAEKQNITFEFKEKEFLFEIEKKLVFIKTNTVKAKNEQEAINKANNLKCSQRFDIKTKQINHLNTTKTTVTKIKE